MAESQGTAGLKVSAAAFVPGGAKPDSKPAPTATNGTAGSKAGGGADKSAEPASGKGSSSRSSSGGGGKGGKGGGTKPSAAAAATSKLAAAASAAPFVPGKAGGCGRGGGQVLCERAHDPAVVQVCKQELHDAMAVTWWWS